MKKILILLLSASALTQAQAQLGKRLADKVKNAADRATDKIINQTADRQADKVLKNESTSAAPSAEPATTSTAVNRNSQGIYNSLDAYASYDFIPGDSVLFADDFMSDDANEIPAHWLLRKGKGEVNEVDGERMIGSRAGSIFLPRIEGNDYLPARFTIEFDLMQMNYSPNYGSNIRLFLSDAENKNTAANAMAIPLRIWAHGEVNFGEHKGDWPYGRFEASSVAAMKGWKHVAISVNEKGIKLYLNQYRILNAPLENMNPTAVLFDIAGDYQAPVLIKNFRIMSGGKQAAKQVTTKQPYIARGILFEKASANLLPESMGEINELVKVMKADESIRYNISGHTSAENGEAGAASNQTLSEQRAAAVKTKMVSMGIDAARLESKGFGQSKPVADNKTPEGRSANRRVEFIRL